MLSSLSTHRTQEGEITGRTHVAQRSTPACFSRPYALAGKGCGLGVRIRSGSHGCRVVTRKARTITNVHVTHLPRPTQPRFCLAVPVPAQVTLQGVTACPEGVRQGAGAPARDCSLPTMRTMYGHAACSVPNVAARFHGPPRLTQAQMTRCKVVLSYSRRRCDPSVRSRVGALPHGVHNPSTRTSHTWTS